MLLLASAVTLLFIAGCNNNPLQQKPAGSLPPITDAQFAVRGFHVDLRIQVMTMDALKALADELAAFGMNTLVMEWRHPIHIRTMQQYPMSLLIRGMKSGISLITVRLWE